MQFEFSCELTIFLALPVFATATDIWKLFCLLLSQLNRQEMADMVFKVDTNYSSWRRKWQPTLIFLPGKSRGQRTLVGQSPRGGKESDTTEQLGSSSRRSEETRKRQEERFVPAAHRSLPQFLGQCLRTQARLPRWITSQHWMSGFWDKGTDRSHHCGCLCGLARDLWESQTLLGPP